MSKVIASKNLLFIAPSAYPLGGVQTWLDYIIPGLASLTTNGIGKFDTSIALTSGQYHRVDEYLAAHSFDNVHIVENPTGLINGRVRSLEKLIRKVNPDIVLVANIVDVYHAVNNLRANGNKKLRVVTTLHGIHPGLFDDVDRHHKVIDAVLVTNKLTQKLVIEKTRIESVNVLYAPYGVETKYSVPSKRPSESPFTVAYVGRIEEDQKRISDTLIIFEELLRLQPQTRILIAGDGPKEEFLLLTEWLAKHANSNVSYLGVLNSERLRDEVYRVCDVLLLTSHWETGPIVAWEAFQYSVTLVSSRYIGYLEESSLVNDVNCLMFDIGDTNRAVEHLIQLKSRKRRQQLNEKSKALLLNKYSMKISIDTWAAELTKVANKPAKTHIKKQKQITDSSRLLTLLRPVIGMRADRFYEYFHVFFGLRFKHQSAGSEWPHSYSSANSSSSQLTDYIADPNQYQNDP